MYCIYIHLWPIVPAPADCEDEEFGGKPKDLEKTYPGTTFSTINPTWPDRGANPGCCCGKPATNHLRYGTDMHTIYRPWFWEQGQIKTYVGSEVLTAVVMKGCIFWDITPCSPLYWFLAQLILRTWRWRWHVPLKHRLIFNRLQGVMSQNTGLRKYVSFFSSLHVTWLQPITLYDFAMSKKQRCRYWEVRNNVQESRAHAKQQVQLQLPIF
jgi:hypothetical protein